MIVVDTSTLAAFFLGGNHSGSKVRKALWSDTQWAAPAHQPAEMINVARGLVRGRKLTHDEGSSLLDRWSSAGIEVLPFSPAVVARTWELRNNLTSYDAAYVAVAEVHELALVTGDRRLAGAPDPRCEIRLVR